MLDPKLQPLATQIAGAFTGGPYPKDGSSTTSSTHDAGTVAACMLSAYHGAALANPAKAIKGKGFKSLVKVSHPPEATDKFWGEIWDVVTTVGPVVLDVLNKDFKPEQPNLGAVIQHLPTHRRNDKEFADFATTLLLSLAQGTVQALSGPSSPPPVPQPPAGVDKDFWDDAWGFVQDAAGVIVPIAVAML